ncbi:MAG: hypothetical protein K0U12_07445 [Gammaproteobacteria bacterium]|nr:hypothetical protein [Gammaproteobacteria bacterium]
MGTHSTAKELLPASSSWQFDDFKDSQFKKRVMWLWILFTPRRYARNHDDCCCNVGYGFSLFVSALSGLFAVFFPFKIIGWLVFLGLNGVTIIHPIEYANQSRFWLSGLAILVGVGLIMGQGHLGFTFFKWSVEKYIGMVYLFSGGLGVLRRLWNALIWRMLDRLVAGLPACQKEAVDEK